MSRPLPPYTPLLLFLAVLLAGLLFAGACAGTLPASIPTADTTFAAGLTATALCIQATDSGEFVALWYIYGSPTPNPNVPTATPLQMSLPVGDPAEGKAVFNGAGNCGTCHRIDAEETFVGPSLKTIANRAAYKRPGMDAVTYLYNVILNPDQTINPLTKPGVMPRTFKAKLTDEQIADVIAYLLTLDQ
jgi:mono/diheme cytochrome c family protein